MMLLLRALVILGAVLAVLSCTLTPIGPDLNAEVVAAASAGESCSGIPLAYSSALVPAAFVMIAYPGGGLCL